MTIGNLVGLAGWAEEVAQAIERRFLETDTPDLTIVSSSGAGDDKERAYPF